MGLVGIAEINPLWVYSMRGEIFHENWEDWGKQIEVRHKYAIVFATEMGFELVGAAPHTPTTIASMGNYAKGAFIATQLAAYIANLGYSATANHLRHYDAVLVPLAVDAGLGELELEGRPLALGRLESERAAVLVHDLLDHEQTEPRALRSLRAAECREQLGLGLLGHSASRIPHPYASKSVPGGGLCLHSDRSPAICTGVQTVHHEVEHAAADAF